MTRALILCCCMLSLFVGNSVTATADEPGSDPAHVAQELNAYWAEVSQAVLKGDFAGYSATCHPEGILVSGIRQTSYPLTQALERWKPGFDDTRAGQMQASVEFRFSQRLHSSTTAHETGIFRYASRRDGQETIDYINFEGLLQKSSGRWRIVMEYQKSLATAAEWQALAPIIGSTQ